MVVVREKATSPASGSTSVAPPAPGDPLAEEGAWGPAPASLKILLCVGIVQSGVDVHIDGLWEDGSRWAGVLWRNAFP